MKHLRHFFNLLLLLLLTSCHTTHPSCGTLFVWGGDIEYRVVEYVASLTGKENPHLLFLPTASGDHPDNIARWESICDRLGVENSVLGVWVDSWSGTTFDQTIAEADAIVIGGGNTLNMLGIWREQGIDTLLIEALERGVVIAGGSAGSICWFDKGMSDSRPTGLSLVDGLGVLPMSNCPHNDQAERRALYHQLMLAGGCGEGYAQDEKSGILFCNGEVAEAVSWSPGHHSYHVTRHRGEIVEHQLPDRLLIAEGALAEGTFTKMEVNTTLQQAGEAEGILGEFARVAEKMLGGESVISNLYQWEDMIAVVHDSYLGVFGSYGLWYGYVADGVVKLAGEDLAQSVGEAELMFREKIEIIRKNFIMRE